MSRPPVAPDLDLATRRALAVGLFNYTWTLLENPNRSPGAGRRDAPRRARLALPLGRGRRAGEPRPRRVAGVARVRGPGRGEPALYHARRCVEINEANADGREDWDLGSAYEAMARASAVAGDRAASDEWKARAVAELARIADAEDRQVLEQDIATLP